MSSLAFPLDVLCAGYTASRTVILMRQCSLVYGGAGTITRMKRQMRRELAKENGDESP